MSDRELLELAAKAAGSAVFELGGEWVQKIGKEIDGLERWVGRWNPLEDDGDALRLAVKLGMQVGPNGASREPMVFAWARDTGKYAEYVMVGNGGPEAATRRAIVRAAAEIGKAMP